MARIIKRKLGWYAVLDVPRMLHKALGKKYLMQSLETRVHAEAVTRSRKAYADLQEIIDAALRPPGEAIMGEADLWRESVIAAQRGERVATGTEADEDQEAFIRGMIGDRAEAIGRRHGDAVGGAFAAVASGRATPLLHHLTDWLREGGQKGSFEERTKDGHKRSLALLEGWMKDAKLPLTIEAIGRREAGQFVTECLVKSGRHPTTSRSIVSVFQTYWTYLDRKGLVAGDKNPWDGQAPPKAAGKGTEDEGARAFTGDEVARLLAGPADAELADLMRVGALTGMRINEAYELTVKDCAGEVFNIRASKTNAGKRQVPIHPALSVIVARRSKGKAAKDYLFHEPGVPKAGRERSMAASKRFGRYRQQDGLDVHERGDGQRRSRVTFHSFRRWFITEAIRAGQPERLVQQVVGHKAQGMTMGVYFGGDLPGKLRECVAAVSLPAALDAPPQGTV